MPRKKAKEKDALKYEIKTRVNEKRYRSLVDLLAKTRHRSMSEMIREILNNKPITVCTYDKTFDQHMEQLISLQQEIQSIGVNINQVTRFFHGSNNESHQRNNHSTLDPGHLHDANDRNKDYSEPL